MKTTATLCILVAFAIVQVSSEERRLDAFQYAVKRMKAEVNAVINDLTRLERNTQLNVETSVSNIKHDGMLRVNSHVKDALHEMRVQVDKAKEQGKKVEHCYVSGQKALNRVSQDCFKVLDTCSEESMNILKPAFNNVEATIEVGNQVITNLDAIFVDCYSPDVLAMEMCIASRMPGAGLAVKKLRESAGTLQGTVQVASKNAQLHSRMCTQDAVSVARNDILKVLLSVNQCVA